MEWHRSLTRSHGEGTEVGSVTGDAARADVNDTVTLFFPALVLVVAVFRAGEGTRRSGFFVPPLAVFEVCVFSAAGGDLALDTLALALMTFRTMSLNLIIASTRMVAYFSQTILSIHSDR